VRQARVDAQQDRDAVAGSPGDLGSRDTGVYKLVTRDMVALV